jgi:hypothetical protein
MKRGGLVLVLIVLVGCGGSNASRRADGQPCADADCAEPSPTRTSYRKVTRDPDRESDAEPTVDAAEFESFDPAVASARLSAEEAAEALEKVGIDSDGERELFRGDFASAEGEEYALVGETTIEVRGGEGDRIARRELGTVIDGDVRAVQLIDDRLELVLRRKKEDDANTDLVVLRVIGSAVAEVFVHDVDQKTVVEFVRRAEERAIRVTRDGAEPELYLWNHWEGVFRIPRTPPTAPR